MRYFVRIWCFLFCIYFSFESITIAAVTPFIFYCLNYLIYLHTHSPSLSRSLALSYVFQSIVFTAVAIIWWAPKNKHVAYNSFLYLYNYKTENNHRLILKLPWNTDFFARCCLLLSYVCMQHLKIICKHSIYCSAWLGALNLQP